MNERIRTPTRPNISASISDGNVEDHVAETGTRDRVRFLVERAREGDRDAFGELYRIHHGPVYRLTRFHLGPGAEDAVAETFLRAWTSLGRYRDTGAPFAAWLYGIARHVVADGLRARRRTEPRAQVPDTPTPAAGTDDRLVLAAAIARLPREQRQVIELKFLVGLANPEIATALGKSEGAVNALRWRALRTLRGMVQE